MVGKLLLRGMLAGLIAGLISFGFLQILGEPQIDRAIAYEHTLEPAYPIHQNDPDGETVSRGTQSGIGLLTGTVVYGAAFGGLFGLVFAFANGRGGPADPRSLSTLLALAIFLAVYLVPYFQYPPSPPAVGNPETIGVRTLFYFIFVAISIVAMTLAITLQSRLAKKIDMWSASLIAAIAYFILALAVVATLPTFNEIPATFPADLLWKFRIASLGGQVVLWTVLALVFGHLTLRADTGEIFPMHKAAKR